MSECYSNAIVRIADRSRLYDERQPLEPAYPSIKASLADFVIEEEPKNGIANGERNGVRKLSPEEQELAFAPPGYVHFSP